MILQVPASKMIPHLVIVRSIPPSTEFTSPSETQPAFLPPIPLDISPGDDITDDEPYAHDSSEPKSMKLMCQQDQKE